MKTKWIVLLCVVFVAFSLAGCGNKDKKVDDTSKAAPTEAVAEDTSDDFVQTEDNYYPKNVFMDDSLVDIMGVDSMYLGDVLEKTEEPGIYDGDIIPDAKTAKRYADLIWKYVSLDSSEFGYFGGVFYDSANEIWEVFYVSGPQLMCGGDIEIAISKKTGEVLRIMAGE